MSISPVMSPMIYSYVPSAKKEEDEEYKKIKIMLQNLGIEPTGSKETDKILLTQALQAQANQGSQKSGSSDYIPFLDIMNTLNLTSSGKIDKDYTSTINELDYRISLANDDEEKQYYQTLRDEVDTQYTDNNYDKTRQSMYSGASQVADLNKYMLGL